MSRSDPIRDRYFEDVEKADKASDILFYLGAFLSIASLLIEKSEHPVLYDWTLIFFAIATIGLFGIGMFGRLYLTPRAEDCRRKDFVGSALGVSLTHEKTDGYYNNDLIDPIARMAAQLLENSFFSKSIAARMARGERLKFVLYAAIWLTCVINRRTDLGILVAASQAVFSEQIISKFLRLEWLRMRFEKTYEQVYRTFQARPAQMDFNAMTLESLATFETAKANAAITLSSRLFSLMNDGLSTEWEQIKAQLKI